MSNGPRKPAPSSGRSPRWFRTAAFAAVLYLFLETLSYSGLWVLRKVRNVQYSPNRSTLNAAQRKILTEYLGGRLSYYQLDPTLGWVMAPPNANQAGMRDDREYDPQPAPGVSRFAAFGDSYTYSDEVGIHDSWAKQINTLQPSLEVLNYGLPASAPDQGYLRYLEVAKDYHPAAVFIGYMTENLERDVNVYRPFYSDFFQSFVFTKPRFKMDAGRLALLPNPLQTPQDYQRLLEHDREVLPEIGKNDYFYQHNYNYGRLDFSPSVRLAKTFWREFDQHLMHPIFTLDGMYDSRSEAFQVTANLLDEFYRKTLDNGALPIILVFPNNDDQERRKLSKARRYQPLLDYFRQKGFRYLDMQEALAPYPADYVRHNLFTEFGRHYSAQGNTVMAKYIISQFQGWDLTDPAKLNSAAQAERQRLAH